MAGFEIHGIGAERRVMLHLEHASVHHYWITAVTRDVEEIDPPRDSPFFGDRYGVYGAQFEHLATPGRTIRGVVRDKETGEPIAGVQVRSTSTGSSAMSDQNGRYELPGCLKQPRHRVEAVPMEQPFFATNVQISDTGGLAPIDLDLQLVQGIQVRGRVTDRKTGKPVSAASVHYSPLYPNEHAATLGDTIGKPCSQAAIQPDGSFAITVMPGPGVVAVQAFEYYGRYMPALVTRDELVKHFKGVEVPRIHSDSALSVYDGSALSALLQKNYNEMKLIDPAEGAQGLTLDLVLDPGATLTGKLIDQNGKPVTGASAIGLTSHVFHVDEIETDAFEVRAVNPRRGRHVLFYHKARNLGAVVDVEGDESGTLIVKMQSCGAVSGQLLDANNEPRDGVTIECNRDRTSGGPGNVWAKTDARGRFHVEGLAPGQKYSVRIANLAGLRAGRGGCPNGRDQGFGQGERAVSVANGASGMNHWQPYRPNGTLPWNLPRVVHLHRRSGFGATWKEIQRDLADGPDASIGRILKGRSRIDALPGDFAQLAKVIGDAAVGSNAPNRLKAWWVYRMLFTPDPLTEKLALMWHNHFATSNLKINDLAHMRAQNELFRKLSRAPFGELLRAVVRDPGNAQLARRRLESQRRGE